MLPLQLSRTVLLSIISGLAVLASVVIGLDPHATTRMFFHPETGISMIGESFSTDIRVTADVPVNVFKGVVQFDQSKLTVKSINYNTGIADLWAEEPWYNLGAGTITFIGGTTKPGGFIGTDTLFTVTFTTNAVGTSELSLNDIRILQHDGLGTDTTVAKPIDALFTISEEQINQETISQTNGRAKDVVIIPKSDITDLNQDGLHNIADVSIFFRYFSTQNSKADFNNNGTVGNADLSILLSSLKAHEQIK